MKIAKGQLKEMIREVVMVQLMNEGRQEESALLRRLRQTVFDLLTSEHMSVPTLVGHMSEIVNEANRIMQDIEG